MNDLLVFFLPIVTLFTAYVLWRDSTSYMNYLSKECGRLGIIPEGLIGGGNCGCCGKWVDDAVVWKNWHFTLCDECISQSSEGKANE